MKKIAYTFVRAEMLKLSALTSKFTIKIKNHCLVTQSLIFAANITRCKACPSPPPSTTTTAIMATTNPAFEIRLCELPHDIVRYHLLSFLIIKSAVKLAQTSCLHFQTLRHQIHRTEVIKCVDLFIQQRLSHTKHIGVCSAVDVVSLKDLHSLLQHHSDANVSKLIPLTHLAISFNVQLGEIVLPARLLTLKFGTLFDQSIDQITLPVTLQALYFGWNFNQSVAGIKLPSSLHTLAFGFSFNQSLAGLVLPSRLRTFEVVGNFNQSIVGVTFPASLRTLVLGRNETLYLAGRFNQSLIGVTFPANLHTLKFGCDFNQSLDGIKIPANLQTIEFGCYFKKSLVGSQFPPLLIIRKKGGFLRDHGLTPELSIVYC